ncbi:MAG: PEP-CTERM sorting domain-containing protein [Phycisphaeraceae bacterium]
MAYWLAVIACLALMGSAAPAAMLTGTPTTNPTMPADLTQIGATDWAYWHTPSSSGVSSMPPTNTKSGGPGMISAATPITGTVVRGSSTATGIRFAFTDGVSPTSSTDLAVSGVFNSTLDTVGRGVRVSVTFPDTQLYKISIWVSGFNSTGTFTAALPGAADYQHAAFSYGSGQKVARLFELEVQADQAGDALTLSHVMTTDAGGGATSSHVLIAGVAIEAIPEPASLLLLGGAGALLLVRRRHGA